MEEQILAFILKDGGKLPKRGSLHAAGLDICANVGGFVPAGEQVMISTGVYLAECPSFTYLRIAPRSKLAHKFGIDVMAGVVDLDYRGEIKVILRNHGSENFQYKAGDAIAQLILTAVDTVIKPVEVTSASSTERGEAGVNDKDLRL